MLKKSVLVLVVLSLSGCGLAPGMKMDKPSESVQRQSMKMQIEPTYVPITADLLTKMDDAPTAFKYTIGPQDVLNIVVWDHPELSYPVVQPVTQQGQTTELTPTVSPSGYLVGADGNVFFPLVGNVNIGGKTLEQARAAVAAQLSKYVRNPQVDVRVISYRSKKVYVMGEVGKPGLQPITDIPMSVTDAINLAGGLDQSTADPGHIYIIRGDMLKPTVYWLNANSPDALLLAEHFRLKNHDIVFVSTDDVARWNRAISQIMPTIQSVWYTQSTIKQG